MAQKGVFTPPPNNSWSKKYFMVTFNLNEEQYVQWADFAMARMKLRGIWGEDWKGTTRNLMHTSKIGRELGKKFEGDYKTLKPPAKYLAEVLKPFVLTVKNIGGESLASTFSQYS
ncbi:MAG: hypothetical protein M1836_001756 [Candelina mexicana]|nr:MAG: hypothetical protein M1836_001756 [Candelina mexicana]